MKAILMSIRPRHVCNILNGIKKREIRSKFPKDYVGWVYIYCTKDKKYKYGGLAYFGYGGNNCVHLNDNKMVNDFMDFKLGNLNDVSWTIQNDSKERVVARFWCDNVTEYINGGQWHSDDTFGNYDDYIKDNILEQSCLTEEELFAYCEDLCFYAIHITKLEIFDEPKEIAFMRPKHIWKTSNKHFYKSYQITRAPQSWCYIEVGD